MKPKIESCPFCGAEDVALIHIAGVVMYVECQGCHATGPHYAPLKRTGGKWPRKVAVDAWNTRFPFPVGRRSVTAINLLRH